MQFNIQIFSCSLGRMLARVREERMKEMAAGDISFLYYKRWYKRLLKEMMMTPVQLGE